MNSTVFRISLDIHEVNSQVTLRVKKGDSARQILIALTEGGRPYKISEDCMAVFTAKKPDETILYNGCEIRGNRILYAMTPQTCTVVGAMKCEIRVYGAGGALITSPRFTILVDDTVYSDGDVVDSSSEFSALTELMAKAQQIIAEYEAWLENAEDYATQEELQKLQTLVGEEEYLTLLKAVSVLEAVYGIRADLTELGEQQQVVAQNAANAVLTANLASEAAADAQKKSDAAATAVDTAVKKAEDAHTRAEQVYSMAYNASTNAINAHAKAEQVGNDLADVSDLVNMAMSSAGYYDTTEVYRTEAQGQVTPEEFLRALPDGGWMLDDGWCLYKFRHFTVDGTAWRIEETWTDDQFYTLHVYAGETLAYSISTENGTITVGPTALPNVPNPSLKNAGQVLTVSAQGAAVWAAVMDAEEVAY